MDCCDFCLEKDTIEKICECYLCKNNRKRILKLCDYCYIEHIDKHFLGDFTVNNIEINGKNIEKNYAEELKRIYKTSNGDNSGLF